MGNEVFYMVMIDGQSMPTKRHEQFGEAHEELERLVRKHGKRGWILQTVGVAHLKEIEFRKLGNFKS